MTHLLLTASMCFMIGGFLIPIYAPSVAMDKHESKKVRFLASVALLIWAAALSFVIQYFVRLLP